MQPSQIHVAVRAVPPLSVADTAEQRVTFNMVIDDPTNAINMPKATEDFKRSMLGQPTSVIGALRLVGGELYVFTTHGMRDAVTLAALDMRTITNGLVGIAASLDYNRQQDIRALISRAQKNAQRTGQEAVTRQEVDWNPEPIIRGLNERIQSTLVGAGQITSLFEMFPRQRLSID